MNYFANGLITFEVLVHPFAEEVRGDNRGNEDDCDSDNDFDKHNGLCELLARSVGSVTRPALRAWQGC